MTRPVSPEVEEAVRRLQSFVNGEFASASNAHWPVIKDIARIVLHLYKRQVTPMDTFATRAWLDLHRRSAGIPRKQVKLHGGELPLRKKR